MPPRYFQTLPDTVSDARAFKMLDLLKAAYLRHGRGWSGGERVVRRAGASIEFAGHRSYDAGDDLRHMDWHLLARLDEPYIKTYQEQEYYYVHILLDASASMFGMREGRKFEVAGDIATALSYLTLAQDDRLMLARAPDSGDSPYRTAGRTFMLGRHQMPVVRQFLSQVHPDGLINFEAGLARYIHADRRRMNRAVLISDFQSPISLITDLLSRFQAARCHLSLIRLIDPEERTFEPDRAQVRVHDLEAGDERVITLDEENRQRYMQTFNEHRASLIAFCARQGMPYIEIDTAKNWFDPQDDHALMHHLVRNHLPRNR